MASLEEVAVESRGEAEEQARPSVEESASVGRNRRRSKASRRSSRDSEAARQNPQLSQNPKSGKKSDRGDEHDNRPTDSQERDSPPTQEDLRAKFYEIYRREAEEYDKV